MARRGGRPRKVRANRHPGGKIVQEQREPAVVQPPDEAILARARISPDPARREMAANVVAGNMAADSMAALVKGWRKDLEACTTVLTAMQRHGILSERQCRALNVFASLWRHRVGRGFPSSCLTSIEYGAGALSDAKAEAMSRQYRELVGDMPARERQMLADAAVYERAPVWFLRQLSGLGVRSSDEIDRRRFFSALAVLVARNDDMRRADQAAGMMTEDA